MVTAFDLLENHRQVLRKETFTMMNFVSIVNNIFFLFIGTPGFLITATCGNLGEDGVFYFDNTRVPPILYEISESVVPERIGKDYEQQTPYLPHNNEHEAAVDIRLLKVGPPVYDRRRNLSPKTSPVTIKRFDPKIWSRHKLQNAMYVVRHTDRHQMTDDNSYMYTPTVFETSSKPRETEMIRPQSDIWNYPTEMSSENKRRYKQNFDPAVSLRRALQDIERRIRTRSQNWDEELEMSKWEGKEKALYLHMYNIYHQLLRSKTASHWHGHRIEDNVKSYENESKGKYRVQRKYQYMYDPESLSKDTTTHSEDEIVHLVNTEEETNGNLNEDVTRINSEFPRQGEYWHRYNPDRVSKNNLKKILDELRGKPDSYIKQNYILNDNEFKMKDHIPESFIYEVKVFTADDGKETDHDKSAQGDILFREDNLQSIKSRSGARDGFLYEPNGILPDDRTSDENSIQRSDMASRLSIPKALSNGDMRTGQDVIKIPFVALKTPKVKTSENILNTPNDIQANLVNEIQTKEDDWNMYDPEVVSVESSFKRKQSANIHSYNLYRPQVISHPVTKRSQAASKYPYYYSFYNAPENLKRNSGWIRTYHGYWFVPYRRRSYGDGRGPLDSLASSLIG